MTVLLRSVDAPLEVAGDGRTLEALICPYNSPTRVDDGLGEYLEAIDRNAFARVMRGAPSFVRLHLEHDGQWVGRGHEWVDSPEGLRMVFRVDDTEPGRTAIFKVKDGQVPGMSIGYIPGRTETRSTPDGPVQWRMTVKTLHHTALVARGAYPTARVEALRSAPANDRADQWRAWLESVKAPNTCR